MGPQKNASLHAEPAYKSRDRVSQRSWSGPRNACPYSARGSFPPSRTPDNSRSPTRPSGATRGVPSRLLRLRANRRALPSEDAQGPENLAMTQAGSCPGRSSSPARVPRCTIGGRMSDGFEGGVARSAIVVGRASGVVRERSMSGNGLWVANGKMYVDRTLHATRFIRLCVVTLPSSSEDR